MIQTSGMCLGHAASESRPGRSGTRAQLSNTGQLTFSQGPAVLDLIAVADV